MTETVAKTLLIDKTANLYDRLPRFISRIAGSYKPYVYEWSSESEECLYIGKGAGGRAWHLGKRVRGQKCIDGLSSHLEEGKQIYVRILVVTQTPHEALYYERALIWSRRPKWNTQIWSPRSMTGAVDPTRKVT